MRRWVSWVLLSVLLAQALLAAAPAYAQFTTVHVVQRGETLYSIARYYGVSVSAICAANSIANPRLIYAGQRLVIPVTSGTPASAPPSETSAGTTTVAQRTHVVQPGENLYRIALRYGTTIPVLAAANGISEPTQIRVGQTLVIPGGASGPAAPSSPPTTAGQTHIVQLGETLSAIARRYGVSVWVLARANSLANPGLIVPGQVLVIPGSSSPAPTPGGGGKRIVIDLSEQHLYAYQNGALVYSFVVSSGKAGSRTRAGTFSILDKYPNAYASTWDLQMPYFMGIYWSGSLENGIHALPILSNGQTLWGGYLGTPASFGCIILSTENARTLYYWADIGTPVVVQY
ncbi:MAG: LysM peptidoglycan-binding domain-containing protein [Anaerolineae bacterium]|nr:LysM peptidoglycan-binding domain-containing protein [Anaerolineae bacterium]